MRRSEAEMDQVRRKYREKIFQPEFREKSAKDQGLELGVSDQTIYNWKSEISPERWQQILDMTRKQSAKQTLDIDDGLYRKARAGDAVACKLWYEIHGWSPRQINENLNKNAEMEGVNESELAAKIAEGLSPEALEAILAKKKAVGAPEGVISMEEVKEANGK